MKWLHTFRRWVYYKLLGWIDPVKNCYVKYCCTIPATPLKDKKYLDYLNELGEVLEDGK